ncbi:class I SAM-dependent methyltransferase [uncultured Roseobacter sp.]|uniref:class I SAM-dependent methyltransferase n=1 Tax=uncultured Roseobacter sp. TaxID=114847 RepID=UPI00260C58ED|nr:class I SAM-dependent methyltransferase [uncultured Roseobacter sp.]
MSLPTIGTLWVGKELSWLEQLCLKSFLDHDHDVVLFTYDDVEGVPDGTRIADANEILPADRILRHKKTGSPAYHADVFRLHMMQKTDFIWADTDAFCCQPWVVEGNHFHGWISDDKPIVNNGVLRLPKSSQTLAAMLRFTDDEFPIPPWYSPEKQADLQDRKNKGQGVHVSLLPWGVWGPDALTWFLRETGEVKHSQPGHVIYPVPFKQAGTVLIPNRLNKARSFLKADTLSIHFWGRRFRNVAAKYGGVPTPGCLVHELLQKHEIDPVKTQHLFAPAPQSKTATVPIDPSALDFSMFGTHDVANILLQRSELANSNQTIIRWLEGDDAPLLEQAQADRERILRDAVGIAARECNLFMPSLDERLPHRIADIGCGYAFAGLVLYRTFGCDLVLIDIEEGEGRRFGLRSKAAGYADLATARAFLQANGVPDQKITTVNPKKEDTDNLGEFDLVLSLASCGFHYPVKTYETLFSDQISEGGAIVLDIRKGSGGIGAMKSFGAVEVLAKHSKYSTVITRTGQTP